MELEQPNDFRSLENFAILLRDHPALGFLLALAIGLCIRELVTLADIILIWLRLKLIGTKRRYELPQEKIQEDKK